MESNFEKGILTKLGICTKTDLDLFIKMSSIDEIMKLLEVNLCKACKMKTNRRAN